MTNSSSPRPKTAIGVRILRRIEQVDGCWLWLGCVSVDGYGHIGAEDRRTLMVHRAAYEAFVGPIPAGMQLDHLCRIRRCVNPDHLEPVTAGENIRRSITAQKSECVNGHPYSPENTYLRPGRGEGRRDCRACIRERVRRYQARKRGE